MKITFKDVGQGDSIILEWGDKKKNVGIIDCNKKGKRNPVLDHLKDLQVKEIEFIILSHPHSDHFSGMIELLEYIEQNDICLKKFAHTLSLLGTDYYRYLNWAEIDTAALLDLQRIIEKVNALKHSGHVVKIEFISEQWRYNFAENLYMKCLSPSHEEAVTYMKIVDNEPDKNKKAASSAANYLSTLFCLVNGENYYLLTSDSEEFTFNRLFNEGTHEELSTKSLLVGQLPHHGSFKNYFDPFWKHLIKTEGGHVIASSGYNAKYKHPHFELLKTFYNEGYKIHCTSLYHGSREFLNYLKDLSRVSEKLDTFSALIDTYTAGDKVFPR